MSTQSLVSRLPSRDTVLVSVFPRTFDRGVPWPNPERSAGRFIIKLGRDFIWEAQGEAREAFKSMEPDIKTHLYHCIEPLTSWVTWSMYMIGRSLSSSSPTIIFCSKVAEHRRKIRDVVKNSGILDRYNGIKTGHMPCLPGFDQLIPLTKGADATDDVTSIGFEWPPLYSAGITPATPLTIRRVSHGETSISKATIGGMICIGDRCFFTTAGHAIATGPPSDDRIVHDEDGDCQTDDDTFSFDGSEEWGSATDVSSSGACEESLEEKESRGKGPLQGSQIQGPPSPMERNMREQPLMKACFEFEYPKTVFVAQLEEELGAALDYALIELVEDEPRHVNMVDNGHNDSQGPLTISRVAPPPSQDIAVVLITCHGNLEGTMAANPVYGLSPGGNRVQEMLSATFGEEQLQQGDYGSWVIDSQSGDLYGHLVAGSPTSGKALLTTFTEIFGDIQTRFGFVPRLPRAHGSEPPLKSSGAANSVEQESFESISTAGDNTDTVSTKGEEAQPDATQSAGPRELSQRAGFRGSHYPNSPRATYDSFLGVNSTSRPYWEGSSTSGPYWKGSSTSGSYWEGSSTSAALFEGSSTPAALWGNSTYRSGDTHGGVKTVAQKGNVTIAHHDSRSWDKNDPHPSYRR